jgi:hypothetical protein
MPNKYIDDFDEFYEMALNRKCGSAKYSYGKVPEKLANEIIKIHCMNVKDFDLILHESKLRHIIKRHGQQSEKDNEIKIQIDTIRNLDSLLNNFESITSGYNKNDSKRLLIKIRINGTIIVVEEVGSKRNKTLRLVTMYYKKGCRNA